MFITSLKKITLKVLNLHNILYNRMLFKIRKVEFVNFPKINGRIMITGKGNLVLGENVHINSSRKSNHIGEASKTIFKLKNKKSIVSIGNHTGLSNTTFVCRSNIKVGNYVKIGGGVKIYDSDAHSLDFQKRMNPNLDKGIEKPVIIKDHVFIGAYSMILKGVIIGEKSIIGAGSVVTKSIPDGEIWAGNPAKFIRKLDS